MDKAQGTGGESQKIFFGISPAPTSKFMGDIPNPTAFGSHGFLELWELPGNSQSFHIQKFISCRERCLLEWELFRNIQPKPLEFHWELLSQSLLILGLPRLLHGCGIPQKKWNLGLPCSRLLRKSRIWKLGDLVAARKTAGAEHGKGFWQESRALGSQPMEFKERFPCLDPMFDG